MKRKAHYLQKVASGAWPAKIVAGHASVERKALDGEYKIAIDSITCWHLCELRLTAGKFHGHEEIKGVGPSGLLTAITRFLVRRKTTILYLPHAYRVLTAAGLWDEIELGNWCVCEQAESSCSKNGQITSRGWNGTVTVSPRCTIICCRCVGHGGTVRIVDTVNFGLDVPNDPTHFTAGFSRVFNWSLQWHNMLRDGDFGAPQNTAASQASKAYRYKYIETPILVHDNHAALGIERQAVHSGRCECYTLGTVPGEVYQLDSSSHYAAVAMDTEIPCRLRQFTENWNNNCKPSERPLERMIANVTINTPDAFYPACRGEDIVYPIGVFRTTLCGPELVLASNEGHLHRIHSAAVYDMDRPFAKFYASLWKQRQKSNAEKTTDLGKTIKAMLSRFHGKFCQRAMSWITVPQANPPACFAQWYAASPNDIDSLIRPSGLAVEPWHVDQYVNQKLVKWRSIGWQVQVEVNGGEHRNSCPAIAAWILSLGRIKLLQWIMSAGQHNVHYIDTDSLWTNRHGYIKLLGEGHIKEGELGYLRLVAVHKRMHIDGLKTYTVDGDATHAGIPDEATMQANGEYRYYLQPSIASSLRGRHLPVAASFLVERNAATKYRHGTPTLGGRVMPLRGPFDLEARNVNSHPISCTCYRCKPYDRRQTNLH